MPVLKVNNHLTGKPVRLPENGTEKDALLLALDLRDLIRDNTRKVLRDQFAGEWPAQVAACQRLQQLELQKLREKLGDLANRAFAIPRFKDGSPFTLESFMSQAEKEADLALPRAIQDKVHILLGFKGLSDFQKLVLKELAGFSPVSNPLHPSP